MASECVFPVPLKAYYAGFVSFVKKIVESHFQCFFSLQRHSGTTSTRQGRLTVASPNMTCVSAKKLHLNTPQRLQLTANGACMR